MIEEIKKIKSKKSDLRKFGITVGVILLIVAGFLFWREKESFRFFFNGGIILFVFGIVMPVVLMPVYWLWMILTTILGWFMTRVILSLLFYVIITPIGLISRLFGKQFLELRWDKLKGSYWNYRTTKQLKNNDYKKQF